MREEGFTLVEVLVALFIFGVVMASASVAFISNLRHNTEAEKKMGALAVAQQILDDKRVQDPTSLPSTGAVTITSMPGMSTSYSASLTYCAKSQYCSSASRHLLLEVFYNGDKVYETETVFTQLK